ncbi:TPA: HXXEE domain-containing protein [Clostridioides difficile]|uniref:HXXEE domain-containing protein n=1 Tax=Clostridioides difficile TaxID=1496 RepID=UPI00038D18DE|nr:HXXEE domain-containing protein [Clostridioides difficile]EGT3757708.1 HXXEE domain-containing protein [Clostridioides difficile]EGT3783514.1 HXXEE domain-containing protein [Clostridioides difficile]EGT4160522.1 HXXEE domain-containing protein [Clostridioides difficile]EGT4635254.1 HXXEE domain-containing protein [Clostridioides difficile]EGT5072414.1 HXXEE domain-containing protein [Clostridioides difficile]
MGKYIWLFPLLFIFHDMEEIIGFGIWLKKNKSMLDKKYPFISKIYENYSTEGMAFAVFEEFILCIIFCILTVITENQYVYLLWLGSFIAYTLHLVIHIGQSIIIRKYIPSLITSIICLPISIWCISKSIYIVDCEMSTTILYSIIGIIIVALNLKFAQSLIGKFTKWMSNI